MSLDDANDPSSKAALEDGIEGRDAAWDAERATIRSRIAAAVARAGPHPIAGPTLALLTEAAMAAKFPPAAGNGAVAQALDETGIETVLADLRARHPGLFGPPQPEPAGDTADEPSPEAAPAGPGFGVAAVRSAGVLAAASRVRGRHLAASVGAAVARMRTGVEARLARGAAPEPGGVAPVSSPVTAARPLGGRAAPVTARVATLAATMAERASLAFDHLRETLGPGGAMRRPSLVAAFGAVGLVGLAIVLAGRGGDTVPVPTTRPPPSAAETPASPPPRQTAPAQKAPPNPTQFTDEGPPPDDAPMEAEAVPGSAELTGPTEVIDTATLKVAGRVVRLFGVVWVRGGQVDELKRYLSGRSVSCRPVAGSDAHLCSVDGRDLSEVVLFNGGGRASPEATPDLVAAEDRARTERLGVWGR